MANLLSQLGGLRRRHGGFRRLGSLSMFLQQYAFHLAQCPKARRQPGVKVGSELADEDGPPHELVVDDLSVGGENSFLVVFCHRSATQQTK